MSGPTEFTQESVRQYMLAKDGKVTNHELVKYFKAWLTHPTEKESARQRFKEYVNTLATIKQENGEKYLVLRKKFYPNFEDDSGPSLLDEVMAGYQPIASNQANSYRRVLPPTPQPNIPQPARPPDLGLPAVPNPYYSTPSQSQRSSYASLQRSSYSNGSGSPSSDIGISRGLPAVPPPYRPPPSSNFRSVPPPTDFGLPVVPNYGQMRSPPYQPGISYTTPSQFSANPNQFHVNPSQFNPNPNPIMMDYSSMPLPNANRGFTSPYNDPPPLPSRNGSKNVIQYHSGPLPPLPKSREATPTSPPPLPVRNPPLPQQQQPLQSPPEDQVQPSNNQNTVDEHDAIDHDKENSPMSTSSGSFSGSEAREKISVKERTKTFNRMASEVDVGSKNGPQQPNLRKSSSSSLSSVIKRRNSRAQSASERRALLQTRDDESDSSSINTIDQNLRRWMVLASQGDYHVMMKMLREDPRLARHSDFTSGFTALHWAAKHGNVDMVKMLAGNYQVDVNYKSHGGYTPLHLACQFGCQEVFDVLVKAYGADARIRDNYGKTPRQYMMAQGVNNIGLSLSSDTFRQLKDRRRSRREASEKTPSILRFGSLSVKVKKTTEAFNNYFGNERKTSWHAGDSGPASTGLNGISDSQRMPPPKFAPIKKRKSKRSIDFGKNHKSAPTTPTERSPKKDFAATKSDESDSEYGFDSAQWNN